MASADTEKTEVLKKFFASGFIVSQASNIPQVPEHLGGDQEYNIPPTVSNEKSSRPPDETECVQVHGA